MGIFSATIGSGGFVISTGRLLTGLLLWLAQSRKKARSPKGLPKYTPKECLDTGCDYNENVRRYGAAPKGYAWLKVGDAVKGGDIYCSSGGRWEKVTWFVIPIGKSCLPIARPVEKTKIFPPKIDLAAKVEELEKRLAALESWRKS